MTASGAVGVASADSDALEAEGSPDSNWNEGMQFLASVVGCAAVGTVLWSEFVLKDSGVWSGGFPAACVDCLPFSMYTIQS
jgi:hypothetical protein